MICITPCGLWQRGLGRSAALLFLPIAGLLAAKRRLAAHPDPHYHRRARVVQVIQSGPCGRFFDCGVVQAGRHTWHTLRGIGCRRNGSCCPFAQAGSAYISERTRGSAGAGRVMRLTTTATISPAGTPNTPAEMGWMPNHRPSASNQPAQVRKTGTCESM